MIDFNRLKARSSTGEALAKLQEQSKGKASYKDDREWRADVDKDGNGYAVIRFLDAPPQDGEDGTAYVKYYQHGFKGPGGWYIEKSLTSLGKPDPVSEYNTSLWNSGIPENKKKASSQKRKLTYVSNILVVTDPKHPENEGKVFLFKYGAKIYEKINAKLNPKPELGETLVEVFDLFKGANFKLRICKIAVGDGEAYTNYDKSEFDNPSPIASSDAEIERIWRMGHSLKDYVAPDKFKTYDQLKDRLNIVLGAGGVAGAVAGKIADREDHQSSAAPQKTSPAPQMPISSAEGLDMEDEDGDLDFFKRLANNNE